MRYEFSILDLLPFIFLYGISIFLTSRKLNIRFGNYEFGSNASAYTLYLLMLCFSSIRYGIGYDYYSYMNMVVNDYPDWKYEMMEPLALLFIKIGKFFNSYELYFALYALFTLYPIYWVSKKLSLEPSISMLIYLLYPFCFISSLDIIRNSLAFSWVFLSYYFLIKKKKLVFILCCVVAAQVHSSAYVGLFLYFIHYLPSNKYFYVFLLATSYLLGDIISRFTILQFIPGIASYLEELKPVGSMKFLMVIFAIVNYFSWDKVQLINQDLLKIVSVGLSFFFLFVIDDTLSFRLSTYFVYYIILLIPIQLEAFKGMYNTYKRMMISFFIGIILFQWLLMINNYQKTGDRMSTIPYQTIFYKKDYSNYVY